MEDMKNFVIQSLETRGVLGQIRAKLRSSVFKIVDEQDQRFNMGCGLKWENQLLYKITDTKVGTLIAELMREFMEFLKMDYSLSVFIPECSISPERLKRDEILAKLGLKISGLSAETPLIYYILYYFMESALTQPEKVTESLYNLNNEVERQSDEIIENNLRNYYNYQNNINDGEEGKNAHSNDQQHNNIQEERKVSDFEEEHQTKPATQNIKKQNVEFERIDPNEINQSSSRRSYEYEDRRSTSNYGDILYKERSAPQSKGMLF
jgi:lisH domain-containing protein FOPNL